jgi:hypothetical protein
VRGHVVDEQCDPIPGMHVTLTIFSTGQWDGGVTDANGNYDVACPDSPLPLYVLLSSMPVSPWAAPSDTTPNYGYRIVGNIDPSSAWPLPVCTTSDETPVVTTLHPGGVVTGHVYLPSGQPGRTEVFASDTRPGVCGRCGGVFFETVSVDSVYTIVGLPTGDYILYGMLATDPPTTIVHVDAGTTTTQDLRLRDG